MLYKILKNDLLRKKIITVAVFVFIMLSALLMASGTNLLINLNNSLNNLFKQAAVPHFVQSHAGKIDQERIDEWSSDNRYVQKQQTVEMINIPGEEIYINGGGSESDTLMDLGFVKQNKSFDFLLNLNNEVIKVDQGEIAVPIYYMKRRNLSTGDKLKIKGEGFEFNFIIKSFVRDAQMNPSIISSKRFVVNKADFRSLKQVTGEKEYLISFRLNERGDIQKFSNEYTRANLPQKGPTIVYNLLKVMNGMTDGLIAAVIILISLLLNIVALLCLRFIILLTLEEDYKDIGVMKAIGVRTFAVKKIYISKYLTIAFTASVIGYLFSFPVNRIFMKNVTLYTGKAPTSLVESILPLLGGLIIAVIVVVFSLIVLRRFKNISAVEAIRMGNTGGSYANKGRLALHRNKWLNNNVFLGLRDVFLRFRLYIILFIVFILCTFIIIVPINFLNTVQSPNFVTYMGMGRSDIIMDLRQSDQILRRFETMKAYIKEDREVEKYASSVTCKFKIINQEGVPESTYVETGDFTAFPVDYLKGEAPLLENEIALSYLSADQLNKGVGDKVKLIVDGEKRQLTLSGIYQDITNGGRTAKANIEPDHETASWYNIYVDVNGDVSSKASEYERIFDDAKITDVQGYIDQTFGSTINQLELLIILAIIIAVLVTVLITSLFLKTLVAKDTPRIAIMKSMGVSLKDIRIQYLTRALVVLIMGILVGTVVANTLGHWLLSAALSIVGAANIEFIVSPFLAYILIPVALITIVTITTLFSIKAIKKYDISDINVE